MNFFKNKIVFIIILIFGLIYCSISLVNHYLFRTYALDLGVFNNALFDYAHFRWNDNMIHQPSIPILGDHFTLLHFFYVPFYWIFSTYTLLIIQIAAILIGGYGVYKYCIKIFEDVPLARIVMIHFFCTWGIYSALSYDYHDNVVGAMFVPWFFLYFELRKYAKAAIFFTLILMSKENMALWGIFLGLGLFIHNIKNPSLRGMSLIFSAVALVYFVMVMKVIMPAITGGDREYLHLHYSVLGNSFSEIFKFVVTNPVQLIKILFTNHLNEPIADGIKEELFLVLLLSGGFALILKPQFLLMLLPILGQKLFSDDFGKWGINYQYSIEFTPILSIAIVHFVKEFANRKFKITLAITAALSTAFITGVKMDRRKSLWYNADNTKFYSPQHYKREFDVKQMHEDLNKIPNDVNLSASSPLVPHLAFREYVYQFPVTLNAEYIAILTSSAYPLSQEALWSEIEKLKIDPQWELVLDRNHLIIFKNIH